MQDINNIYKPKNHPQVSAPFKFVANELTNTHYPYEVAGVRADDLKPTQPFIDNDLVDLFIKKITGGDVLKPIWTDKDNNILDGHHRYAAHLMVNPEFAIPCIKILCDKKTAMELLNTIEKEFQSYKTRIDQSGMLKSLSEHDDSMYIKDKDYETKKELVVGYRKTPPQKEVSGNFFALKPIPNHKAYEIEIDHLLNTDEIDKKIATSKNPPQELCRIWFPSLDYKTMAAEFQMSIEKFVNSVIAEKARIKGIDGIQYGDKLLQAIDDK